MTSSRWRRCRVGPYALHRGADAWSADRALPSDLIMGEYGDRIWTTLRLQGDGEACLASFHHVTEGFYSREDWLAVDGELVGPGHVCRPHP